MRFEFDPNKNEMLIAERGVSFDDVIEAVEKDDILADLKHPNEAKYPNQRIFVVNLNGYPYCVPYVIEEDTLFLKTVFPNRRFKHLLEGEKDG